MYKRTLLLSAREYSLQSAEKSRCLQSAGVYRYTHTTVTASVVEYVKCYRPRWREQLFQSADEHCSNALC